MQPLQLIITQGGLDALVNAQAGGTDAIRIVSVGLTESSFTMAPTIDALPDEFKRIETVSGQSVSETVVHMVAIDAEQVSYDLCGFGLYLADGTLFAVYAQDTPIFRKVGATTFLFVQDIAFEAAIGGAIEFGDALFVNPPASESVKGVAEIATPSEAAKGEDHQRFVTPFTLHQGLAALASETDEDLSALENLIVALMARSISGSGLVTGGGDLRDSRTLTVQAADAASVASGTSSDRAITPAALSGLARSLSQNGYATLPGCGGLIVQWGRFSASANSLTNVLFPIAFPGACFSAVQSGGVSGGADSQDNPPVLIANTITASGFSVFSADDSTGSCAYLALGV